MQLRIADRDNRVVPILRIVQHRTTVQRCIVDITELTLTIQRIAGILKTQTKAIGKTLHQEMGITKVHTDSNIILEIIRTEEIPISGVTLEEEVTNSKEEAATTMLTTTTTTTTTAIETTTITTTTIETTTIEQTTTEEITTQELTTLTHKGMIIRITKIMITNSKM